VVGVVLITVPSVGLYVGWQWRRCFVGPGVIVSLACADPAWCLECFTWRFDARWVVRLVLIVGLLSSVLHSAV
jgi:hypothetical protein